MQLNISRFMNNFLFGPYFLFLIRNCFRFLNFPSQLLLVIYCTGHGLYVADILCCQIYKPAVKKRFTFLRRNGFNYRTTTDEFEKH